MAKSSDTFFLRGQVVTDHASQTRVQSTIDLGAFVNLGSSKPQILRIHSIQQQICDSDGLVPTVDASGAVGESRTAFLNSVISTKATELGTGDLPQLNLDEVIYTAAVNFTNGKNSADNGFMSTGADIAPQHLVNGILVGVDTLYLYALGDNAFAEDVHVNFMLECSVEPATRENAIAIALSQA
jgi:hypothetical protein